MAHSSAYLDFEDRMTRIKEKYFESNGNRKKSTTFDNETYDHVMHELIEQLYHGYTAYGSLIRNFENNYGSSKYEYADKVIAQYNSDNVPENKRKSKKQLFKEWEKEALKHEYLPMLGTIAFIKDVEEILKLIQHCNHTFTVSDALEKITSKTSGIPRLDIENRKLLVAYKNAIKADIKEFKKAQTIELDRKIMFLRFSALYKYKSSIGIIHKGDHHRIGGNTSFTFEEVFAILRSLAREINVSTKNAKSDDRKKNLFNESRKYSSRIKSVKVLIDEFEANNNEKGVSQYQPDYRFTVAECEEIIEIRGKISGKICELKSLYDSIKKREEDSFKIVAYIDAVKERISAIDETIRSLELSTNNNPNLAGHVNIFKNTINMFNDEKEKCVEFLSRYEDIIEMLEKLFKEVNKVVEEIDQLYARIAEIMAKGKERKEKDDYEKERMERKDLERRQTLEELDQEERISHLK